MCSGKLCDNCLGQEKSHSNNNIHTKELDDDNISYHISRGIDYYEQSHVEGTKKCYGDYPCTTFFFLLGNVLRKGVVSGRTKVENNLRSMEEYPP